MIKCKGTCDALKKIWGRPFGNQHRIAFPFKTYGYCRTCALWVKHEHLWNNLRCPCCHGRVARKPRLNSLKRKYIVKRVA